MANRDNHYEAAFEESSAAAACRTSPWMRPNAACSPTAARSRASTSSSPRRNRSPGWSTSKAEDFPAETFRSNTGRTGPPATPPQPGGVGTPLRREFLRAVCLRLQHPRPSCAAARRGAVRVSRKRYGFVAVRLSDYAAFAHPISTSWDTLAMSAADFRRTARPLDELLGLEGRMKAEG